MADTVACLLLKVDQSVEDRRPSGFVALAVGMFRVWVEVFDENPQPPFDEVVAKVCIDAVRPLSEVIAVAR